LAWVIGVGPGQSSAEEQNVMILIPSRRATVGTRLAERKRLAERFDCHPSWLNDDLPEHEVRLPAFWIDRFPVTNAQYLTFVEATGHSRPSWWGRWGNAFPAEYAQHPVVGVSGMDAMAYAKWAGKRLPSAEEWETAVGDSKRSLYAWGDAWPGPLKKQRRDRISWDLPETRAVGSGGCGRSEAGLEDFAGQALEWIADVRPHHGVQFQGMKGASWFHEDPLSYRVASGNYAYEGWRSAFTGFRCALAGNREPPRLASALPKKAIPLQNARAALRYPSMAEPPLLAASGGNSRHLSIRLPRFGGGSVDLSAPETILWNGAGVMTWRLTPDMTWTQRTAQQAAYEMRFPELRVQAKFTVHNDLVEQQFTAVNLTGKSGTFRTSSCFSLQGHPMFYDCEQIRTYVLTAAGRFLPMRRLSRGGDCVHWITGPGGQEWGGKPHRVVLAVVSRDGRGVIATGQAAPGMDFSLATNTCFTCLHTDSTIEVPGGKQATSRQVFWFLEGALEDLLGRLDRDLKNN
jgi:formylglycine-generating enzyme required for sulfatase activity